MPSPRNQTLLETKANDHIPWLTIKSKTCAHVTCPKMRPQTRWKWCISGRWVETRKHDTYDCGGSNSILSNGAHTAPNRKHNFVQQSSDWNHPLESCLASGPHSATCASAVSSAQSNDPPIMAQDEIPPPRSLSSSRILHHFLAGSPCAWHGSMQESSMHKDQHLPAAVDCNDEPKPMQTPG